MILNSNERRPPHWIYSPGAQDIMATCAEPTELIHSEVIPAPGKSKNVARQGKARQARTPNGNGTMSYIAKCRA